MSSIPKCQSLVGLSAILWMYSCHVANRTKDSLTRGFAVFAYCVMPDHFHLLVQGLAASSNLLAFVKTLKQKTAFEFERKFHRDLWQNKFYDHILRPNDSVEAVAAYIWLNPVRKGLCDTAQDYPFSGSFAVDWKQIVPPSEPWLPSWKKKLPA